MDRSQKLEIVERYIATFNAHDLEGILTLFTDEAMMEDPVGTPPARGKEAIGAGYREGFGMGVRIELDGVVRCAGNSVAFPLRTAMEPRLFIIDVFDFDAMGRIERMRAYWSRDE